MKISVISFTKTGQQLAERIRESRCARNGTPAVGSIGFGADNVSGRSRVPFPPTSTTASTFRTATSSSSYRSHIQHDSLTKIHR